MGILGDLREWVKDIRLWRELGTIPSRMENLETRVNALEKALEKAPGDPCPKCGERAMRLRMQGKNIGIIGQRGAHRLDLWGCTSCDFTQERKVEL